MEYLVVVLLYYRSEESSPLRNMKVIQSIKSTSLKKSEKEYDKQFGI